MTSIFNGVNENLDTWHRAIHHLKSVSNIVNACLIVYNVHALMGHGHILKRKIDCDRIIKINPITVLINSIQVCVHCHKYTYLRWWEFLVHALFDH